MSWRLLPLEGTNLPQILVKWHFDNTGYSVKLTDLSRIWSESRTKDEIIQHASAVGSSIDPSEDEEQFQIFVGKIQSALQSEHGTSLYISSPAESNGANLQLSISAPLPRPLPAFNWTLELERQSQQQIEKELVIPLILRVNSHQRQIKQLIHELQDKDRVISKICDRLETSGNDLTTVFPGVSNVKTSRKKSQREQLAQHVRGLDDFDEHSWRQNHVLRSKVELNDEIINDVFKEAPLGAVDRDTATLGDWWKNLSSGSRTVSTSQTDGSKKSKNNDISNQPAANDGVASDKVMEDNEFQRQATPPQMKSTAATREDHDPSLDDTLMETECSGPAADLAAQHDDDSTTEDEDDLDAPPRTNKLSSSQKQAQPSQSPRKLGMIGGRATKQPATSSENPDQNNTPEAPKLRSKPGAIGGKANTDPPISASPPASSTKVVDDSSIASRSKLGASGGKESDRSYSPPHATAEKTAEPVQTSPSRESRSVERQECASPRETSEERADRKRDQLKRELEEKAKAPSKKKRRF